MKILFIDTGLEGHHLTYMTQLISNKSYESILYIPSKIKEVDTKQFIFSKKFNLNNYIEYYLWLKEIKNIADVEKPDIIHFLYGDKFYRFFGKGLTVLANFKIIMTFHQTRKSKLHKISIKNMFKRIDLGVVHTTSLLDELKDIGIKNIEQIDYPHFNKNYKISRTESKEILNIKSNDKVLLVLGETRDTKGLDILLEALKHVNQPFHLIIAGVERDFNRDFIVEKIASYKDKVTLKLKFLTEREFYLCLNATDYVVLPYRKTFDGASGPMGEGIWLKKPIIGPNHGSLGEIITSNKVGVTFETENVISLAKTIEFVIVSDYQWNEQAEQYRNKLDKNYFSAKYESLYGEMLKDGSFK